MSTLQLAFAPLFISTIVATLMALEGRAADASAKLRADLPEMLRSNWALWVPFQFINFRFVPVKLQVWGRRRVGGWVWRVGGWVDGCACAGGGGGVHPALENPPTHSPLCAPCKVLTANVVALAWNTYMSAVSHR